MMCPYDNRINKCVLKYLITQIMSLLIIGIFHHGLEAATPMVTVRIGMATSPEPFAAWVAYKKEFFKKNGIDIIVRNFDSAALGLQALGAGEVDVSMQAAIPTVFMIGKGLDVIVLADYVEAKTGTQFTLVAAKDIASQQDLKGKKLAVAVGTGGHYAWSKYFERHKMKEDEVSLLNISPPESIALICRGDISALYLWEPFPTKALEACPNKVYVLSKVTDHFPLISTVTTSKNYAMKSSEVIKGILKTLIEASQFIFMNPQESSRIFSEWTQMDIKAAAKLLENYKYRIVINKNTYQVLTDVSIWAKSIKRIENIPEWKVIIDSKYLKSVNPDLVSE